MRYMISYDFMETMRNTNQWLGATAQAIGAYPAFSMVPNPGMEWMRAWGEVTERTFQRMVVKPDWGIPSFTAEDGKDHLVSIETVVPGDFGDLIHFDVTGRKPRKRKVLLVAPMSGHYATLLRSTVMSLMPDCEVYVTDWHNARDIPVSARKIRCRGLHTLPRRLHALPWSGRARDRGLSTSASYSRGHGLSCRRRPQGAATIADTDWRPD